MNSDTGEAGGVFPSLFLGMQTFAPGEHIVPTGTIPTRSITSYRARATRSSTRHRFDWSRGDTFGCPPMASHEHVNTGTEHAIQYVIQDMPARAMDRNLMWEEPIGKMFHMVEGNVPHQD